MSVAFVCSLYFPHLSLFVCRLCLFANCIFLIYLCSCVGFFVCSLYFPHLSLFVCRLRLFSHYIFFIYLCSCVDCVCLLTVFFSSIFVRVWVAFVCSLYFPHLSLFVCRLRLFAHYIFLIYLCSCVDCVCLLTVFFSSIFVRGSVAFVCSLYFPHLSLFVCRLRFFAHYIFLIYLCSCVDCVCLLNRERYFQLKF